MRETSVHQAAFEAWYAGGRIMRTCIEHANVSHDTILRWMKAFDWHARADERDREIARQAERDSIARQVKVLNDQRTAAELMRRRGVEYFTKHELEDGRTAIVAITKGIALEREAAQIPPALLGLLALDDAELEAEQQRVQRRVSPALDQPDSGGAAEPESDEPEAEVGAD